MENSLMRKCQRCGGFMHFEKFYDHDERFWGLRCIICGEIVDPVILQNRELMRAGQRIYTPEAIKDERKVYA